MTIGSKVYLTGTIVGKDDKLFEVMIDGDSPEILFAFEKSALKNMPDKKDTGDPKSTSITPEEIVNIGWNKCIDYMENNNG